MADQVIVVPNSPGRRGPRGVKGAKGDKGDQGDEGAPGASGSGTIENTLELIEGDGAGAGVGSGILAAAVAAVIANNTGTSSGTNTGDQTDVSGNAGTVTTNANLTGHVTSVGNATTIEEIPADAEFTTDPTSIPPNRGGWEEYFVTGSDVAETGQSLVDITGLISDTLAAGARYEFEAKLVMTVSADTTGARIGIHLGGSGGAGAVIVQATATSNAATSASSFVIGQPDTASLTFLAVSSGTGIVVLHGFFTTRSSGTPTISLQQLKFTSGTVTTLIGSIMKIRRAQT